MRHVGLILCATLVLSAANPKPLQNFRMPNGLQVRLVEDHDRPLVRLQFRTSWDPKLQDGQEAFLGKLLATAGAGDLNREAFLRELEENALSLRFQPGPWSFTWSLLSTSQTLDPAVQHLAMMVSRPLLEVTSLEALQRKLIEEPGSARDKAEVDFLRSLGDPEVSASAGPIALQLEELLRLRRRLLRPEHSVLVMQGDLNLDQARQMAALHFGAWGPGVEPRPEKKLSATSAPVNGTRCWSAEAPGNLVEIRLGAPMAGSDSRLARALAARLLRRELATAASGLGNLTLKAGPEGPWVLQIILSPSRNVDGVLASLQTLLTHWRERKWTETELALTRRLWRAEILVSALHPWEQVEEITGQAEADPLVGLESVKPEEIHRVLLEWLEPAALRWLVLGGNLDAAQLSEKVGLAPLQKNE